MNIPDIKKQIKEAGKPLQFTKPLPFSFEPSKQISVEPKKK